MAAAVHQYHHLLLLPSPPPRQSFLFFSTPPRPTLLRSSLPAPPRHLAVAESEDKDHDGAEFVVVTFYKFVPLHDPRAEVASHHHFLQGRDIHGRIYMNEQGINAQYSGPRKDALAYADWLRKDNRFSDVLVQITPALGGHAFPRLKLRYKPSLVQGHTVPVALLWKELNSHTDQYEWVTGKQPGYFFAGVLLTVTGKQPGYFFPDLEGGSSHLPLVEPSMRASPLNPSEWRERLEARKCLDVSPGEAAGDISGRKLLLLDVRNDYEWDIGHFEGAKRPNVECFRSTSFGMSEQEMDTSDPLNGVDKNTDILMYCTGGIRCDVYSTILRNKGFANLYTLEGGVSNYLKSEGAVEWVGNLFVFDDRLSLPPVSLAAEGEGGCNGKSLNGKPLGKCYVCGSQVEELRHRNCASIDCNRLYLCCRCCLLSLSGCCSWDCTRAPRLRPLLPGHQRYDKWHRYRDIKS